MKKGFTQADQELLEKRLKIVRVAISEVKGFIEEKFDEAEAWVDGRSEKWQESEAMDEWQDWMNELDAKQDEVDGLTEDFNMDNFEEIL